jgi:hypothetical protein
MKIRSVVLVFSMLVAAAACGSDDDGAPAGERHNATCSGSDCSCESGKECSIDCAGLHECDVFCRDAASCSIQCPDACNVFCEGTLGPCTVVVGDGGDVFCSGAASCDVTCVGDCNVVCGAAPCRVTCGDPACDVICSGITLCPDGKTQVCNGASC